MRELERLLGLSKNIEILNYYQEDNRWLFTVQSVAKSTLCPRCHQRSFKPHSRYIRNVQDIPIGTTSVFLQVILHKWHCENPQCSTRIFCERLPWLLGRKRYTARLEEFVRRIAFSTSCLQAEKICQASHISLSHDTLLRILHETTIEPKVSPFCGN